jgi:hypothetical protein
MEENNNNQPISPEVNVTPVTPVPEVPVAPVSPVQEVNTAVQPVGEVNNTEVHPVPSLVIEDTSAPAAPVTPVAPATVTPIAPVEVSQNPAPMEPVAPASVTPVTPVAPIESVTPVAPVAPVTPVTQVSPATVQPVTPATPEIPVSDATKAALTANAAAAQAPANNAEVKPAKKNHNLVAIIIILVCIAVSVGVIIFRNKSEDTPTPTPTPNQTPTPDVDVNSLAINQALVNGIVITFPTTKDSFAPLNWTWDEAYAKNDVEPGASSDGGRIGTAPGGVTVMVTNKNSETKHVEDCSIYSATFFNPKDGSENVTFVGGLGYTSNPEAVKNRMIQLGYTKVSENTAGENTYLRYFLNDDSMNTNDYIEFYFQGNVVQTVTLSVTI